MALHTQHSIQYKTKHITLNSYMAYNQFPVSITVITHHQTEITCCSYYLLFIYIYIKYVSVQVTLLLLIFLSVSLSVRLSLLVCLPVCFVNPQHLSRGEFALLLLSLYTRKKTKIKTEITWNRIQKIFLWLMWTIDVSESYLNARALS